MSYAPEFVALYEIIPYIHNLPLNNYTIRNAVYFYLQGGKNKDVIIKKCGRIGDWNTSQVTDMSKLFCHYHDFNEDISKWDTSNVTTMNFMFCGAESFNQPIEGWDTSNVTLMENMFCGAKSFNQPIGIWDVSKVTDMNEMFYKADNFNLEHAPWFHE